MPGHQEQSKRFKKRVELKSLSCPRSRRDPDSKEGSERNREGDQLRIDGGGGGPPEGDGGRQEGLIMFCTSFYILYYVL